MLMAEHMAGVACADMQCLYKQILSQHGKFDFLAKSYGDQDGMQPQHLWLGSFS